MKRIAKPAGAYNIVVEEVETPAIASTEILIRAECSLISRGSEIWRRYVREEAIDHRSMGYSLVGRVAGDRRGGRRVQNRRFGRGPRAARRIRGGRSRGQPAQACGRALT